MNLHFPNRIGAIFSGGCYLFPTLDLELHKRKLAVVWGDVNWDAPRPFIWQMKELTISGYFSTEVGMTQVLQYIQVPGRFDACLPFEEAGGKVWAFNM